MGKSKRQSFCPHCCSIVPAGKTCPCRNRDAERKVLEPWRDNYRDPEYLRNRQVVIKMQHGRCKDCGKVCAEFDGSKWVTRHLGGEVDHEVPLAKGGSNAASNLALRCGSCHRVADSRRRKTPGHRGSP